MKESWIEIQPGGYLKKFGKHKFLAKTPAEALKAMMMQVPGFRDAFESSTKKGLGFAIVTDKRNINDLEHLKMGRPKVIKLIPKLMGKKSNGGLGQIFAAVAVAALIYFAGPAGYGAGGWLAAGSTSLAVATSIAIGLALGGVTQMLTPQPEGLKSRTDSENEASYAFGGPVNTTAQGNPVPAFYGEREVGGAIISASMTSEDQR